MGNLTTADTLPRPSEPHYSALPSPCPGPGIPSLMPSFSAGLKLVQLPEVTDMILKHLAGRDVVAFMTASKDCFVSGVAALYGTIRYSQVAAVTQSARAAAYCAAVHTIDAQISSTVPPSYTPPPETGIPWLPNPTRYHQNIIDYFVRPLLAQFPNLSKVYFGCSSDSFLHSEDRYTSFVVTLHPQVVEHWLDHAPFSAPPDQATSGVIGGHIEIGHPCRISLSTPPPTNLSGYYAYHAPTPNFIMSSHYNLILHPGDSPRDYSKEWLGSIRKGDFVRHLQHHVDFSTLAVTLDDISNAYTAQAAAGRRVNDRLQTIKAAYIIPFDIYDFIFFADIASTSLVTLDLGSVDRAFREKIYAADILALVSTVRTHLTSLEEFTIGIEDIEQAERDCPAALTDRLLDGGGRIRKLRITSSEGSLPHLNLIRVLAQLCTAEASISVGEKGAAAGQTKYLRYLIALSPARKKHLAVVDFSTLFIQSLDQVSELEYDEDDIPIRQGVEEIADWYYQVIDLQEANNGTFTPELEHLLAGLAERIAYLGSISSTAKPQDVLAWAREVLYCGIEVRRGVARVSEIGKGLDEIITEVRRFIHHLENLRPEFQRSLRDRSSWIWPESETSFILCVFASPATRFGISRAAPVFAACKMTGDKSSLLVPVDGNTSTSALPPHSLVPPSTLPSTSLPDLTSQSLTTCPRAPVSAAHTALGIAEIRRNILRSLPRSDQLRLQRVDRVWFRHVTEIVYHTLPARKDRTVIEVINGLTTKPLWRLESYLSAVRDIGFRADEWPCENSCPRTDDDYCPCRIERAARFFRRAFPNVRSIAAREFWTEDAHCTLGWVINLTPKSTIYPFTDLPSPPTPSDIGHIDIIYRSTTPSAALRSFTAPPGFTLRPRIQLVAEADIDDTPGPPDRRCLTFNKWTADLRKATSFENLHNCLDLWKAPVNLEDLTRIYEQQAASGVRKEEQLRIIIASSMQPFGIDTFTSFARIASTSLVRLSLGQTERRILSYRDLPAIVSVARSSLTSLRELSLVLRSTEMVADEAECGAALSATSLDDGGGLERLRIHTFAPPRNWFNILRVASGACTPNAWFCISWDENKGIMKRDLSRCLSYLRKQSHTRKNHLAVVDFGTALYINKPEQIFDLEYDIDDRPIRRPPPPEGLDWAAKSIMIQTIACGTLIPDLDSRINKFAADAARINSLFATSSPDQMHDAVQGLLASAMAVRRSMEGMARITRESDKVIEDLDRFVTLGFKR